MKLRICAVMAVVTMLFASSVFAGGAGSSALEKIDVAGIENYTQFDGPAGFAGAKVGFGGATQATAMHWLKSNGFATVINLRVAADEGVELEATRVAAETVGLNYIHLPFDPENFEPGVVDKFLLVAGDTQNQPVFIHCNSATRAAAMWMIGRVLNDGLEMSAAESEVTAIAKTPPEALAFATAYIASQEQ